MPGGQPVIERCHGLSPSTIVARGEMGFLQGVLSILRAICASISGVCMMGGSRYVSSAALWVCWAALKLVVWASLCSERIRSTCASSESE